MVLEGLFHLLLTAYLLPEWPLGLLTGMEQRTLAATVGTARVLPES